MNSDSFTKVDCYFFFFSKHTSDVYPVCLKLSRQPKDIIGGNGNGVATVEDIWVLKELNNELPKDSAVPLLGIFTRESNTGVHIAYVWECSLALLHVIAKKWKQFKYHQLVNG